MCVRLEHNSRIFVDGGSMTRGMHHSNVPRCYS